MSLHSLGKSLLDFGKCHLFALCFLCVFQIRNEDAAGIAGLHSRRHEAELSLRSTEANLARLNDVMGQLNSQVESLKRQARAARRYKEVSGDIRRQEVLLLHLTWAQAQALVETEETNLSETLAKLGAVTQAESQALAE